MNALREIWIMLDRRQRRTLALMQVLTIVMALSTLAGIAVSMQFLTALAEPQRIAESSTLSLLYDGFGFDDERSFIVALGIGFAGLIMLSSAINLLGSLAITRFARRIGDLFHAALLDEYLHRDYLFHTRNTSSALLNKVVHTTGRVTSGLLESGLLLITAGITIALIMIAAVFVNARAALIAVVLLSAIYMLIYVAARRRLFLNGLIENQAAAERVRVASDSLGAVKEILVVGNQEYFRRRFADSCHAISRFALNSQAIAQSPKYVLECVTAVVIVIAVILLSAEHGVGSWLAELTFLGFAAYRLLPAIQQVFASVARIRANRPMFDSIADDLRRALRTTPKVARVATEGPLGNQRAPEIRLENVCFQYARDARPAVRDVTLCIPAGSVVGLVGRNGSGKTTLVDIVLGLLAPDSGRVLVDGRILDDASRAEWQSRIAYVPQTICMLDASIAANIVLGAATDIDRARMVDAARRACLDEFVRSLPNGYDDVTGERGIRLSGGQRQCLGIARALYRNASVIIMDEATSALDGLTEQEILAALYALRGTHTIIVVAHRMSALSRCDIIFELETGALVRSGSWHELGANARFRRMLGQIEERDDNGDVAALSTQPGAKSS